MFRGACFFHVFLDCIFSKFEPKMVPKLDTWRDTLRHRSVFFVTWFLQARRAPPLRISVVFRLPFECVLFDLGVHFGHCRIPPRDHFGIELQEFFWKLFIIRRCYLHVSLTPATQSVHHPSSLHHPPSVWELICKSESPSLERKGRRNSRRDNNTKTIAAGSPRGVHKEEIQQWRQARSRPGEKVTLNVCYPHSWLK